MCSWQVIFWSSPFSVSDLTSAGFCHRTLSGYARQVSMCCVCAIVGLVGCYNVADGVTQKCFGCTWIYSVNCPCNHIGTTLSGTIRMGYLLHYVLYVDHHFETACPWDWSPNSNQAVEEEWPSCRRWCLFRDILPDHWEFHQFIFNLKRLSFPTRFQGQLCLLKWPPCRCNLCLRAFRKVVRCLNIWGKVVTWGSPDMEQLDGSATGIHWATAACNKGRGDATATRLPCFILQNRKCFQPSIATIRNFHLWYAVLQKETAKQLNTTQTFWL